MTLPAVDGDVTLKYAVIAGSATSDVYEQSYELRAGLAVVTANPGPAVPGTVLEGRQDVMLESSLDGRIFYTTDGTRPRLDASNQPVGSTQEYSTPIPVTRTTSCAGPAARRG